MIWRRANECLDLFEFWPAACMGKSINFMRYNLVIWLNWRWSKLFFCFGPDFVSRHALIFRFEGCIRLVRCVVLSRFCCGSEFALFCFPSCVWLLSFESKFLSLKNCLTSKTVLIKRTKKHRTDVYMNEQNTNNKWVPHKFLQVSTCEKFSHCFGFIRFLEHFKRLFFTPPIKSTQTLLAKRSRNKPKSKQSREAHRFITSTNITFNTFPHTIHMKLRNFALSVCACMLFFQQTRNQN